MTPRDGHIRVLPLHVANKIAAGEVVERPASVVKELVENSIDAGAKNIRISVTQGGRKLVSVQDDGCGMSRDDAVLSLERQATSKILDVNDIEEIDTLGFRGEAIPSIASVSRFTITTRRRDSDDGTFVAVNAGELAEVRTAGCPPGTLVEVRDLFCNVPARRKFLRAYATEEGHVRHVFTVHALAHPSIGFSLTVDGREAYRLAPAATLADRVLDVFGPDFVADMLPVEGLPGGAISVTGYIERPNLNSPTRRDQYVFVNGRPATSPSIAYAMREAYPRRQGDARPAAIVFVELPPGQVDVNVHPTKREVRFRDNSAVKQAVMSAIERALLPARPQPFAPGQATPFQTPAGQQGTAQPETAQAAPAAQPGSAQTAPAIPASPAVPPTPVQSPAAQAATYQARAAQFPAAAPQFERAAAPLPPPPPQPVQAEFAVDPSSTATRPWQWFRFLAQTKSGFLLVETDAGIVTMNPQAARERIAYETLCDATRTVSQPLLIPETVRLPPADAARIRASLREIAGMGFAVEEFGQDTFKIDAAPQLAESVPPAAILSTIARDLAEGGAKRGGARWKEELVAKSIARSCAGMALAMDDAGATRLVEELCACRMPYVSPRGKPTMIFTSARELNRKFGRD